MEAEARQTMMWCVLNVSVGESLHGEQSCEPLSKEEKCYSPSLYGFHPDSRLPSKYLIVCVFLNASCAATSLVSVFHGYIKPKQWVFTCSSDMSRFLTSPLVSSSMSASKSRSCTARQEPKNLSTLMKRLPTFFKSSTDAQCLCSTTQCYTILCNKWNVTTRRRKPDSVCGQRARKTWLTTLWFTRKSETPTTLWQIWNLVFIFSMCWLNGHTFQNEGNITLVAVLRKKTHPGHKPPCSSRCPVKKLKTDEIQSYQSCSYQYLYIRNGSDDCA